MEFEFDLKFALESELEFALESELEFRLEFVCEFEFAFEFEFGFEFEIGLVALFFALGAPTRDPSEGGRGGRSPALWGRAHCLSCTWRLPPNP